MLKFDVSQQNIKLNVSYYWKFEKTSNSLQDV